MRYDFVMNGIQFKIYQVSQEKLLEYYNEENKGYYYAQTHFRTNEIWLSNDMCEKRMQQTLYHELMHCYINTYITTQDLEFSEELLCDISAKSHDIIDEITQGYLTFLDSKKRRNRK